MNEHYEFVNVPLPYDYCALEPFIDEKTMILHHNRHLQTYINNLNSILAPYPQYQRWSLENLIYLNSNIIPQIRIPVMNNAGGVYNHFFYFDSMTDNQYNHNYKGKLNQLIIKTFGSFDSFMSQFKNEALNVFGSGYAYLAIGRNLNLQIISTKNQMTPLTQNLYPLLNIDVWEHAYYLKHYNNRGDYISDWFNVVNWAKVEQRFEIFISG